MSEGTVGEGLGNALGGRFTQCFTEVTAALSRQRHCGLQELGQAHGREALRASVPGSQFVTEVTSGTLRT